MLPETTQCFKMAAPLFQNVFVKDVRRLSAHGRARCLQARRHFGVSCCLTAKVPPPRKPRERVEIPGLEMITYGEKMHYVPGLAKPIYAHWERDYKDPRYYKAPPACEMPLHKEKPCYVYHQRTSALEGSQQLSFSSQLCVLTKLRFQFVACRAKRIIRKFCFRCTIRLLTMSLLHILLILDVIESARAGGYGLITKAYSYMMIIS